MKIGLNMNSLKRGIGIKFIISDANIRNPNES